jgi:hypothetical protein
MIGRSKKVNLITGGKFISKKIQEKIKFITQAYRHFLYLKKASISVTNFIKIKINISHKYQMPSKIKSRVI